MISPVAWDRIEEGMEIPSLSKVATRQMLVKWAGASGDFNPLHFDDDFAKSQGISRPIVHGQLKRAWLVQMLTNWLETEGRIRKSSCQFRGMDYPRSMRSMTEPIDGEVWFCKGIITKKYIDSDEHCLDCDIWIENGQGEKTTLGHATIVLEVK